MTIAGPQYNAILTYQKIFGGKGAVRKEKRRTLSKMSANQNLLCGIQTHPKKMTNKTQHKVDQNKILNIVANDTKDKGAFPKPTSPKIQRSVR